MAVSFSSTIAPDNSSDAAFRLWSKFVFDGLIAGGWVQTADTGQINFATVTRPLAANTMQGYVVVRMNDSLQGTKPVVMKLSFGSGGVANNPAMNVEVGTGSNGSGTITGSLQTLVSTGTGPRSASTTTSVAGQTCHVSATPGHALIAMFVHSTQNFGLTYGIERRQDGAGGVSNAGLYTIWAGTGGGQLSHCQYLAFDGTAATTGASRLCQYTVAEAPNAYQENVGIGLFYLFEKDGSTVSITGGAGTITNAPAIMPPSTLYITAPDVEWTTDAVITVLIQGVPVIFRRLQTWRAFNAAAGFFGSVSAWGRYD